MADWQTQRIAQALLGPREGKLTPENEGGYQAFMAFNPNVRQWKNEFAGRYGEQPNLNDPSFNYREAYTAGNVPQSYEGDGGAMHWDSRGKSPTHPTEWMNTFMQQYGVDPVAQAQQGFTPPQQQTVNQQVSDDMLAQILSRLR